MKISYWAILILIATATTASLVEYALRPWDGPGPIAIRKNFLPYSSSTSATGLSTIDLSGWRTYTNNDYGFEFKYPVDTTVSPIFPSPSLGVGTDFWVGVAGVKWYYGVDVGPNTQNKTLDLIANEQLEELKSAGGGKQFQNATLTVNNIKIDGIEAKSFSADNVILDIFLLRQGNIYRFAGDNNQDLNQFLSTFNFTLLAPKPGDRPVLTTQEIQDQFNSDFSFCNSGKQVNTDAPNSLVNYLNNQFGFSVDLPYNTQWGNEEFRPIPFEENFTTSTSDYGIQQYGQVSYGTVAPFEGCGFVRDMSIVVLEKQTPQQFIDSLKKKSDYDSFIDPKPIQKTLNNLSILEYGDNGLCSYSMVLVFGTKYNYLFSPTCGGDFSEIESTIKTLKLIN